MVPECVTAVDRILRNVLNGGAPIFVDASNDQLQTVAYATVFCSGRALRYYLPELERGQ